MDRNISLSRVLIGVTALGCVAPVGAKTWLDFINLGQLTSNTRLYVNCEGAAPYRELRCRMTGYSLIKEDLEKIRAQMIDVDRATDEELAGLKGGGVTSAEAAKREARLASATPEQRAAWTEEDAITQEMNSATTRPALSAAFLKSEQMKAGTCHLLAYQSVLRTFRRVGEHRWELKTGPSGRCHVSTSKVLEYRPGDPGEWTYSDTIVSAETGGQCFPLNGRVARTEVYSSEIPNIIAPDCKYLMMGQ